MMLLIMIVASFFSSGGVAAASARDKLVIDAHAVFISAGSVIAAGFSPWGPDIAVFNFEDAAQNVAYFGSIFPVVDGATSDD